jgi:hypothetical protein
VRRTGGLADTVHDFDPHSGEGNGFTFEAFDGWQFFAGVVRALETFRHEGAWRRLQRNGMTPDLSWTPAAPRYLDAYRSAVEIRRREQEGRQSLVADMADTARMMATLPPRIARLNVLAYNLWWTWQPEARDLFAQVDPARWDATNHNPVKLLRDTPPERLAACAADAAFAERYDRVLAAFDAYMSARDTWQARTAPDGSGTVAYLSFEFGLHESLPIYSGGLGILAGDTCKEASDLGSST